MDTIDYTQPSKKILIDLINRKNGTNLRVQDFSISDPEVDVNAEIGTDTKVTLTPLAGSGYYGVRSQYYTRMNVDTIFGVQPITVQPTTQVSLSEFLPEINAFYGIHLKEEDIYDTAIPAYDPLHPTAPRSVTLAIRPTSYFFQGSYDFVFGIVNNAIAEDDGVTRTYYFWVDGLPIDQVKQSLKCFNADGTQNSAFNFLSNVSDIQTWTVDKIVKLQQNGQNFLIFEGEFELAYTEYGTGTNVPLAVYGGVLVFIGGEGNGTLIVAAPNKLFSENINAVIFEHPANSFSYEIDSLNLTHDSHLYRYTNEATIDATFIPAISYQPKFIRVTPDNKIYTVSDVYEGADPANNGTLTKLIRVDRLTATGAFDTTFSTLYIRSSDPAYDPVPVMDICPIDTGGCYLAFVPLRTTDISAPHPVINGTSLLQVIVGAGATYSWNPVIRLHQDGAIDNTFKHVLPGLRSPAIYEPNGSPVTWGTKALVSEGEKTFLMTYRRNPITGYEHRQPIQFNLIGEEVLLSGQGYKHQYKWTQLLDIIPQSNGLFLGYGLMQTYQSNGTLSAPFSAIGRYKQNGEIDRLIWRSPGPVGNSNPTVKKVFLSEVTPD